MNKRGRRPIPESERLATLSVRVSPNVLGFLNEQRDFIGLNRGRMVEDALRAYFKLKN